MQRVALSPHWAMIQTSHYHHPLSFTTHLIRYFKTCGIFFENLNSFSSGARLKSIWLVVEKIWNVSNISPNPWLWLPAAGPLSPSWAGTAFCFSSAQICSVFCVLLRCPIGKTSNISNISNCRRPASWSLVWSGGSRLSRLALAGYNQCLCCFCRSPI